MLNSTNTIQDTRTKRKILIIFFVNESEIHCFNWLLRVFKRLLYIVVPVYPEREKNGVVRTQKSKNAYCKVAIGPS